MASLMPCIWRNFYLILPNANFRLHSFVCVFYILPIFDVKKTERNKKQCLHNSEPNYIHNLLIWIMTLLYWIIRSPHIHIPTSSFGILYVKGRSRLPYPPTNIRAFMLNYLLPFLMMLQHKSKPQGHSAPLRTYGKILKWHYDKTHCTNSYPKSETSKNQTWSSRWQGFLNMLWKPGNHYQLH
jgi:hypothetical protein